MKLRLFFLLLLSTLIYSQPAAAQNTVHIGSGIAFLKPPNPGIIFVGQISPDGKFVAGVSTVGYVIDNSTLYLWDLSGVNPTGEIVTPDPINAFDLSRFAVQYFGDSQMAFSPDDHSLALLMSDQILILTLPDFSTKKVLRLENAEDGAAFGTIYWSPDQRFLVAGYGSQIMSWDSETDKTTTLTEEALESLRFFADGWLIEKPGSFDYCSVSLNHCQSYTIDQPITDVDQSRKLIVTASLWNPHDTQSSVIWKQQEDGSFQIDHDLFSDVKGKLTNFSPDGHYATIAEWSDGQNPDYLHYTLYDLETHQSLYEIQGILPPTWLPSVDYFVIGDSLFHPPASEAVSEVSYGSLSDSEIGWWPEAESLPLPLFSDDGRWYLWTVGATAFAVPVIVDG